MFCIDRTVATVRFICILSLICVSWGTSQAQESGTTYWEPEFALSYGLGGSFSQNLNASHRMYLQRDGITEIRGRQVDLVLFTTYAMLGDRSLALGVQYRLRDPFERNGGDEMRLTQQFNTTRSFGSLRIGHRPIGD